MVARQRIVLPLTMMTIRCRALGLFVLLLLIFSFPFSTPKHKKWKIPEPQRSCHAAFHWKKVKPGASAAFHFHKDVGSPPFPEPSSPGPRSQKAVDCNVGLIKRRPIGRRTLSAPAADANPSDVPPSSVSASIARPSTKFIGIPCPSRHQSNKKPMRWDSTRLALRACPVNI